MRAARKDCESRLKTDLVVILDESRVSVFGSVLFRWVRRQDVDWCQQEDSAGLRRWKVSSSSLPIFTKSGPKLQSMFFRGL